MLFARILLAVVLTALAWQVGILLLAYLLGSFNGDWKRHIELTFALPAVLIGALPRSPRAWLVDRLMRAEGPRAPAGAKTRHEDVPGYVHWLHGLAVHVVCPVTCPACGATCQAWELTIGDQARGFRACSQCLAKRDSEEVPAA